MVENIWFSSSTVQRAKKKRNMNSNHKKKIVLFTYTTFIEQIAFFYEYRFTFRVFFVVECIQIEAKEQHSTTDANSQTNICCIRKEKKHFFSFFLIYSLLFSCVYLYHAQYKMCGLIFNQLLEKKS